MSFLHIIRRLTGRHRAQAARDAMLREELDFIECLLDSIYPIEARLLAQRQQLLRALDAVEDCGTDWTAPP